MIFLVDLVPDNLIKLVEAAGGGFWAVLILVVLVVLVSVISSLKLVSTFKSSFNILQKHTDSNHILAESVAKNFSGFGNILKSMMDQSKYQFEALMENSKNVYLSTDLSIDLYRDKAEAHTRRKLLYVKKVLEKNDLKNRECEIKRNIESEFRKITNEGTEKLSRYRSVIGDMGAIINDHIDWQELFEETFEIVFNIKSTKAQKLNDLNKNMDKYVNKIEQVLRRYGDGNE